MIYYNVLPQRCCQWPQKSAYQASPDRGALPIGRFARGSPFPRLLRSEREGHVPRHRRAHRPAHQVAPTKPGAFVPARSQGTSSRMKRCFDKLAANLRLAGNMGGCPIATAPLGAARGVNSRKCCGFACYLPVCALFERAGNPFLPRENKQKRSICSQLIHRCLGQ